MGYNLSLQAEAILEIQEAFEWYEEQSDGLGYQLIEEIEFCCEKILTHPERYSYINQLYRRIKTNRFPYILVFEINGDDIIINSVRHIKREPFL
jgi:toxin ParE1/3/4